MSQNLREAVTGYLMRIQMMEQPPETPNLPYMEAHHFDPDSGMDEMACAEPALQPVLVGNGNGTARAPPSAIRRIPSSWGKVGRNETCPCGSGKKYKHCHGRFA